MFGINRDGIVPHPDEVSDSYPRCTTETDDKHRRLRLNDSEKYLS